MMTEKTARASLGFGADLDDLNFATSAPTKPKPHRPAPETAKKVAEAAGFRSREAPKAEPEAEPVRVQQRRRRTGRNAQLNLKAKPETIAAFQRIADANGWGLGEAFEHATALLEQKYVSR